MSAIPEKHIPVLYGELLDALHFFRTGENIVVDATLGLGGHATGFIEKLGKWDIFIGLDCDSDNLRSAEGQIKKHFMGKKDLPIMYFIHSNFSELDQVLDDLEIKTITALYADLGVSSAHFDTAERGFSFRFDGPLDMRLDTSKWATASELINTLPYEKIAEILRVYGDESRAGFIAKKIIEAREKKPITTTKEFSDIITKAWKDSLPRAFQALRIAVNDEYRSLEKLLESAHNRLARGGSISIISFHSGEDRIVKQFFRKKSEAIIDPITGQDRTPGTLRIVNKKPITPSPLEVEKNPRSRSSLLRTAIKQ